MAYRSLPKFDPEARFIANRAFLITARHSSPESGRWHSGAPPAAVVRDAPRRHGPPAAQHKEAAGAARKGKR